MTDPPMGPERIKELDMALLYASETLPHIDLRRLALAWRERAALAEAELACLRSIVARAESEE